MNTNNNKKYAGCDIEFFSPVVEKIRGYDNDDWTQEKCMTPIYIDPSEFSDDVKLEID